MLTKQTTVLDTVTSMATLIKGQATAVKESFEHDVNVVNDYINDTLTVELDADFETKANITTNRKLSNAGDFTGTWNGNTMVETDPGIQAIVNKKVYYFNTVADMIASTILVDGDCATTLGYYSENDGGNGIYNIVNGSFTDDGGPYIQIGTGTLYAKLVFDYSINVKQFGVVGTTDDTIQFRKAMNFSGNNKITLYLNTDIIVSEPIVLANFMTLIGDSLGRKITVKDGITIDAIFLLNSALFYVDIKNIVLSGNKANSTSSAIKFSPTVNSGFPTCYFSNIYIESFSQYGIYVNEKSLLVNLDKIYVYGSGSQGIYFLGHDSIVGNIYVSACGIDNHTEGAYFGGTTTKFSNIKVFLSGNYADSKSGIRISSFLSQFSNIESQENYYSGLYLEGAYQNQINACCDRNNYGNNATTYGCVFYEGYENQINVICKNNTNAGAIYQQTGIFISSNNFKRNVLEASVDLLHTTFIVDSSTTEYNKINVNRVDFKDYYHDITGTPTISVPATLNGITIESVGNGVFRVSGTASADATHWIYGSFGGGTGFIIPKNHKVIIASGSYLIPTTTAVLNVVADGTNVLFSAMQQGYGYYTVDTLITGIGVKVLSGKTVDFIINPKILVYQN